VSDLHEDLNTALGAVEPGAAPVEAAMLDGRKIRNRRRAGLLAGAVAVVVAAVVGVPAFTHQEALPQPATSHIRVTVNPPGPHSPSGLIASGLVGSKPWNATVESPNSKDCVFGGNDMSLYACNGDPGQQPTAAAPITFEGEGGGGGAVPVNISFGQVWKDVVSARVELSNGTILTLHPAEVDGSRFVAFADPAAVLVDSVTAYSRSGAIATVIPFDLPGGLPIFEAWLRPGQALPARLTGTFGSGTADGKPWRATAYLGPWGTCLTVGVGTDYCFDPAQRPATGKAAALWVGGSGSYAIGTAADSVSYLVITLKDGSTMRAAATAVGSQKFWGVPLSGSQQADARWTAYDGAGKAVGSGSVGTG
jgi:hypothetical protein